MPGRALGVAMSHADIDGGAIDNCPIGGTTAAAGTFTDLTSTGNTNIGNAATDTIGFYGITAVAQPASATQAALTLTTATSGGFGFATSAAFNAFSAQLENIRASLVLLGLLKGAA